MHHIIPYTSYNVLTVGKCPNDFLVQQCDFTATFSIKSFLSTTRFCCLNRKQLFFLPSTTVFPNMANVTVTASPTGSRNSK